MALSVSTPKHLHAIGLLDNDTDSYGMVLLYGRVQRGDSGSGLLPLENHKCYTLKDFKNAKIDAKMINDVLAIVYQIAIPTDSEAEI